MTAAQEAAAGLLAAADDLDPNVDNGRYWIRGMVEDGRGGGCMEYAIRRHCCPSQSSIRLFPVDVFPGELHPFFVAINAVGELIHENIPPWNDQDCLDGHEAANVLRKAAENLTAAANPALRLDPAASTPPVTGAAGSPPAVTS
jgi:hypothetical protein